MKIWEIRPTSSPYVVQVRGTTSMRKKDADGTPLDEWETDFSGFCSCIGEAVCNKVRGISPPPSKDHGVSIHLKSVEVKQPSVQVDGQWKSYTNFNIYDFDFGEDSVNHSTVAPAARPAVPDPATLAYDGLNNVDDEGLPF